MQDSRTRLGPHFTAAEFDCRDGRRWPAAARPGLLLLVRRVLEPLRDEFGPVTVTSGYRHPAYNRMVGGAPRSHHLYDRRGGGEPAADIVCAEGTPADWYKEAHHRLHRIAHLNGGGLGRYPGFIHVDVRTGPRARW